MRKEIIYDAGRRVTTVFHAAIPVTVCPKIVDEEICDGVRMYVDTIGGRYIAETFDRVWGKRDSKAILPNVKRQFQRIRKM